MQQLSESVERQLTPAHILDTLFDMASGFTPYRPQWPNGMGQYPNACGGVFSPKQEPGGILRCVEPKTDRKMVFLGVSERHSIVLYHRHIRGLYGIVAGSVPMGYQGYNNFDQDFFEETGIRIIPRLHQLTIEDMNRIISYAKNRS